jgi:chorismate mutase
VTPEVDGGPIIAQAVVPILDRHREAELSARIHAAEHRLYPPLVIHNLCRKLPTLWSKRTHQLIPVGGSQEDSKDGSAAQERVLMEEATSEKDDALTFKRFNASPPNRLQRRDEDEACAAVP